MSTPVTPEIGAPENPQLGLSEIQRIFNMFSAPTQTFMDIKKNASWWAPFLILAILSATFVTFIGQKITWDQVVDNQYSAMSEKQKDQIAQLTSEQQAKQRNLILLNFKYGSYFYPVVFLIIVLIIAALNMATMNFGFGADIAYKQALAVSWYAGVPRALFSILAIIMIFVIKDPSNFNMQNPVVTNLAVLTSQSQHPVLYSALSFFDIFALWSCYLTGLGLATVSGKKNSVGLTVSFGWYILAMLVAVGFKFITA